MRTGAGAVRRLAHGRDRDPRARARRRSSGTCSPTTSTRSARAARSTRCCAARTAECSTTCSPTGSTGPGRALPDGRQRLQRRLRLRLVRRAGREDCDGVEVHDRSPGLRDARASGPAGARGLARAVLDEGEVPGRFRHTERDRRAARRRWSAAPATRARTASSCCSTPADADAVWDALLAAGAAPRRPRRARHPAPGGLLPALRQRPERPSARRSRRGSKWACALDNDFVGAERLREQAESGTAEKLAPFVFTEPGHPARGLRRADAAASGSA